MMKKQMKINPILKIVNSSLVDLPCPSNMNTLWTMGSLLGLTLMTQIITGLFLAIHYSPDVTLAFSSISHIMRDVNSGWLFRTIHANGASAFFFIMYIHVGRGIYFNSHKMKETWASGMMILFITMATAFLGYVLPWGQMSFWGATVITNLFSEIPYIGPSLVLWMWGGFSVSNATLTRFFSLHFILPILITLMAMIHLLMLHQKGSNNPLGINSNVDKIPFHPMLSSKDIIGFSMFMSCLLTLTLISPMMLNDPENFIPANPMLTPTHIQPEWYFLFAYAILRSIPNKLGGVLALVASVLILIIIPVTTKPLIQSSAFYPMNKQLFWSFISILILLTWIGASPVEQPYEALGKFLTVVYFSYFLINPMIMKIWEINK